MKKKLPILLSGIGNRALPKDPKNSNWLGWVELIRHSEVFELVAAHDVSGQALSRIVERGILSSKQVFQDLEQMLNTVPAEAIIISNPAEFHAPTIQKAIEHNLHMLIEKPLVNDVGEGLALVEKLERKGLVACVVQNWRCKDVGQILKKVIQDGMIGRVGHIFFRYTRDRENPKYPAYIFAEKYPLLYAMGIHHLDLFRYILQDEYKSVSAYSFKPPWSLYKSDTGLSIFLLTQKGVAITYSGTISSKNSFLPHESLLIEGEKGSLLNESQWSEPPLWFLANGKKERVDLTSEIKELTVNEQYNKADKVILENFSKAILQQESPYCSCRDALRSVAVLEASRISCETGKPILLDQILNA